MDLRSSLLSASLVLLGFLVLAASTDHQSYLQLCVCVVNALSRAVIALSASIFFGVTLLAIDGFASIQINVRRTLFILQALSLLLSLFFLIQYVLFLLEVVV